jgi:hypothetical protein
MGRPFGLYQLGILYALDHLETEPHVTLRLAYVGRQSVADNVAGLVRGAMG